MKGDLEHRYRRLLRWYPRVWRDRNGLVLLGTLMDIAQDEHRSRPAPGEARSFIAAGIDARLDRLVMQPVRDAAATVALTMGAGAAIVVFLISSWAPWGVARWADYSSGDYGRFGPFYDLAPLLTLLWVIALVAALLGQWDIGRAAMLLSIPVAGILPALSHHLAKPVAAVDWATLFYSATCALLAAIGTPRTRVPLAAATLGWAAITWTCYAYERPPGVIFQQPTAELWNRLVWPWYITALAIGVAVLLAIARLWTATFTLLLATVPMIVTFDLNAIAGYFRENGNPWVLTAPVFFGLAALLLASSGHLRLAHWGRTTHDSDLAG